MYSRRATCGETSQPAIGERRWPVERRRAVASRTRGPLGGGGDGDAGDGEGGDGDGNIGICDDSADGEWQSQWHR